jgi:cellulose synthase/poly-beta-1,6-N-acetylglucosamine synthase-like glycosyltransferase
MFWVRIALEACAAAALAAVVYHYVGYPLLLRLAAALGRAPAKPAPLAVLPTLSVIVPCYNEAATLPAKLEDLRAADYPADKIEIIVVSDGSDDETEAVARGTDGVRAVGWPERRGKPAALNAGAEVAAGEVLVFTDANAGIPPGSLRELVAPFADPRVGAVSGEQVITRGATPERVYWRWEACIKKLEAAVGSAVGADGSLYAVKRGLYKRVPEGRLIMDDFFVSLEVVAAGYRLAYAPAAVAHEEALDDGLGEFKRKARIMAGSVAALATLDGAVWRRIPWQLFSHKILRWLGPGFLAVALAAAAAAAAAGSAFGAALLVAQVLFYAAAAVGWLWRRRRAPFLFRGAHFFTLANAALAYGWLQYFFGGKKAAWEKLR